MPDSDVLKEASARSDLSSEGFPVTMNIKIMKELSGKASDQILKEMSQRSEELSQKLSARAVEEVKREISQRSAGSHHSIRGEYVHYLCFFYEMIVFELYFLYFESQLEKPSVAREFSGLSIPSAPSSPANKNPKPMVRFAPSGSKNAPWMTDFKSKLFREFRRNNGYDEDQRIYCCKGGGTLRIRGVLESMGFVENPEWGSNVFDIKWSTVGRRVRKHFGRLPPEQLINHARGTHEIDDKNLLLHNLRYALTPDQLAWCFPRSYDMRSPNELKLFILDFIMQKSINLLERSVANPLQVKDEELTVAFRVTSRYLECVPPMEKGVRTGPNLGWAPPKASANLPMNFMIKNAVEWKTLMGRHPRVPTHMQDLNEPFAKSYFATQSDKEEFDRPSVVQIIEMLDTLRADDRSRLFFIPENGDENVWIVKNPAASRGRGIALFNDLIHILEYASQANVKGQRWNSVVQRYIERPLTMPHESIGQVKVDIRLWVVLLDWNPLTVCTNTRPYFRVCGQKYTLDKSSFRDKAAHLSNRTIQEDHANVTRENRMVFEDFIAWMDEIFCEPRMRKKAERWVEHVPEEQWEGKSLARLVWDEHVWPQITAILRGTFRAARAAGVALTQETANTLGSEAKGGPNAFQLLGFDFVLSSFEDDMRPWLLESNSAPSMVEDCGSGEKGRKLASWADNAVQQLFQMVFGYHERSMAWPRPMMAEENKKHYEKGMKIQTCSDYVLIIRDEEHDERQLKNEYTCQKRLEWSDRLQLDPNMAQADRIGHDMVLRRMLFPTGQPDKPRVAREASLKDTVNKAVDKFKGKAWNSSTSRTSGRTIWDTTSGSTWTNEVKEEKTPSSSSQSPLSKRSQTLSDAIDRLVKAGENARRERAAGLGLPESSFSSPTLSPEPSPSSPMGYRSTANFRRSKSGSRRAIDSESSATSESSIGEVIYDDLSGRPAEGLVDRMACFSNRGSPRPPTRGISSTPPSLPTTTPPRLSEHIQGQPLCQPGQEGMISPTVCQPPQHQPIKRDRPLTPLKRGMNSNHTFYQRPGDQKDNIYHVTESSGGVPIREKPRMPLPTRGTGSSSVAGGGFLRRKEDPVDRPKRIRERRKEINQTNHEINASKLQNKKSVLVPSIVCVCESDGDTTGAQHPIQSEKETVHDLQ